MKIKMDTRGQSILWPKSGGGGGPPPPAATGLSILLWQSRPPMYSQVRHVLEKEVNEAAPVGIIADVAGGRGTAYQSFTCKITGRGWRKKQTQNTTNRRKLVTLKMSKLHGGRQGSVYNV